MLRRNLLLALSLIAAPVMAQEASSTIDPGMSHDEVVQRLGKPLNERTSGTHTYMFYRNGCEKSCGMNDLVVLEDGKVVDAVFRNGVRSYSGTSSSPTAVHPSNNGERATSAAARVRNAKRGGIVIAQPASDDSAGATNTPKAAKPARRAKSGKATKAVVTGLQVDPAPPPATRPAVQLTTQPAQASTPTTAAPTSPVLGARINPADSVRALTPNRPTPIPGTKLNATDSARAEAIRRQQQSDSTRKP
ncbi:MAG: hypothetical protein HOQ28_03345 [Thermoleophilia bacterium]|nr:hypothetical protein [Thermoleophilia bacterium]